MTSATLLGWLTPTIGLIMSVAFALVWSQKRSNVHVLLVSIAFGFMTATFVVSQLVDHLSSPLFGALRYGLFATAVILAVLAMRLRSRLPLNTAMLAAFGIGSTLGYFAISHLPVGHFFRYTIANGPIVLLFGYAAWSLHLGSRKNLASWLLFFTICAVAAQFIVRPVVMHSFIGPAGNINDLGSIYWAALNFSAAVCAILLGLSLIALAVSDLFNEVEEKSTTDLLSGLKTRRAFDEAAKLLIGNCARSPLPVSLIVADLDHFKRINDTLGHQTGDRVIAAFGELVQQTVRESDVAGRIGGEEFAVLMWNADLSGARLLAEAMRTEFSRLNIEEIPAAWTLTSSFGVAELAQGEDFDTLYARADEALYAAKRSGRDQVSVTMDDGEAAEAVA